jgi:hypothetical protein
MAHIYASVNKTEVIQELYRRGYGHHTAGGNWALSLNKPGKRKREYDGQMRREPLQRGVLEHELAEILATSENPVVAADRVIGICESGKPVLPPLAPEPNMPDEEFQDKVTSTVKATLAALGIGEEEIAMLKSGEGKVRRKPGPKKGSRRKSKKKIQYEPKVTRADLEERATEEE